MTTKKSGINQNDVQESNRSLIVRMLQKKGTCSRADLARITGLTQATITNNVAALIDSGLVEEVGLGSAAVGRRSILLRANGGKYRVLAIKIERTSATVGVFDLFGKEYECRTLFFDKAVGAQERLCSIQECADQYFEKYGAILAVGVAVPGPYLKHRGRIAMITEASQWNDVDMKSEFAKLFDIPVFIEHDANAGALADWWFGDYPEDATTLVHLLLSEGVGAGVIENGELVLGQQGIAGEIGHISLNVQGELCECGNRGCMELYCSAIALYKRVLHELPDHPESELNRLEQIGYKDIFEAMHHGDALANEMVEYCARHIGYGIVNIVNAYNPRVIVISDIMTMGGEKMLGWIQEVLKERLLPEFYNNLTIRFSEGSVDAVLHGAAAIATNNILTELNRFIDFSGNEERRSVQREQKKKTEMEEELC